MRWGIVGHEAEKFTAVTKALAYQRIRALLSPGDVVISGACPGGGIDRWSIDIAREMGLEAIEHAPRDLSWEGGFKPRNILVAQDCEECVCIVVRELPPSYQGDRHEYCYHCHTKGHVKSGGCWTVKHALSLGKKGRIIVI